MRRRLDLWDQPRHQRSERRRASGFRIALNDSWHGCLLRYGVGTAALSRRRSGTWAAPAPEQRARYDARLVVGAGRAAAADVPRDQLRHARPRSIVGACGRVHARRAWRGCAARARRGRGRDGARLRYLARRPHGDVARRLSSGARAQPRRRGHRRPGRDVRPLGRTRRQGPCGRNDRHRRPQHAELVHARVSRARARNRRPLPSHGRVVQPRRLHRLLRGAPRRGPSAGHQARGRADAGRRRQSGSVHDRGGRGAHCPRDSWRHIVDPQRRPPRERRVR